MRTVACAVLALLVAGGSYCRADDVSDIKASGRAFAEALRNNDIPAAKKHAILSDKQETLLANWAAFQSSREKLTKAAVDKFGDEGKDIVAQRQPGRQPQLNFDKSKFDDADIKVTGDTAVVTSKEAEHREVARFKKEGGAWKVDFKDNPNMDRAAQSSPVLQKLAGVYDEVAAEIKDGKYKSVQEAKRALNTKMAALFSRPRQG